MLLLKKLFNPVQLDVTVTTLYTVPSVPPTLKAHITLLTFTNITNGTVTVTLYLIPKGETATDENIIKKTHPIAPLGVWEAFEARHNLNEGDFIQALASAAASVNAMGSALETVPG